MQSYQTVDEYLAQFSGESRKKLNSIRKTIKDMVPKAEEKIAYGIPTYKLNGKNLVHFGGYEHHVSLYPGSLPIAEFRQRLSGYKTSKGTVQFPLDRPLPIDLIADMVAICIERNISKGAKK